MIPTMPMVRLKRAAEAPAKAAAAVRSDQLSYETTGAGKVPERFETVFKAVLRLQP